MTVINRLCKNGHVHAARDLLWLMLSILLDSLCKTHMIAEAFSFLRAMEDKGVSPNTITYRILINGLCKDGKLKHAKNLLNGLLSKDEANDLLVKIESCSECAPDSMAYNNIIHGLLKMKEIYKAMSFLEEMYKRGFSGDSQPMQLLRPC
ncbi:hypothetical protein MIMGU_mgv11b021218mg [Erythranthe guttata]|uniref:Pentacotripeptide-repeat region of PRORP domain-containing protein n=1 Tax=Erythranthe guttata TaxID=4155 RepID=A0A022QNK0_ERYGU|nr:hypothetical protein MIMGU_mgv11b021218mg [Erythranthe guttata]